MLHRLFLPQASVAWERVRSCKGVQCWQANKAREDELAEYKLMFEKLSSCTTGYFRMKHVGPVEHSLRS